LPTLEVGGAENQIAALALALDRQRFLPLVACQHSLGPVAEKIAAGGVPVHLLGGGGRFDLGFLRRLTGLLKRERVRLIVAHGFSTGVAARLAASWCGVPVRILAEHSTGERDMSPSRHLVNRLLAPWTTAWVSVAASQREYLVRTKGIPPSRLFVIPNGIDLSPFPQSDGRQRVRAEWGFSETHQVAGSLAALRPEKNHKSLLLAARFAVDEFPDARFVIVGEGPLREDLKREIHALDLSRHVVLAGRRADVPAVLAAFDVSVLCSTDVETLPLAFLESMASGLPLVGTRVGGVPELIEPEANGFLVRPRDPRGLADALLSLMRDPERARRFGEESRRRVERSYAIETMVRGYEDLFARLLEAAGISAPSGRAGIPR
jgi:glycosyltransferase involved in cell wall biosynthesis